MSAQRSSKTVFPEFGHQVVRNEALEEKGVRRPLESATHVV